MVSRNPSIRRNSSRTSLVCTASRSPCRDISRKCSFLSGSALWCCCTVAVVAADDGVSQRVHQRDSQFFYLCRCPVRGGAIIFLWAAYPDICGSPDLVRPGCRLVRDPTKLDVERDAL